MSNDDLKTMRAILARVLARVESGVHALSDNEAAAIRRALDLDEMVAIDPADAAGDAPVRSRSITAAALDDLLSERMRGDARVARIGKALGLSGDAPSDEEVLRRAHELRGYRAERIDDGYGNGRYLLLACDGPPYPWASFLGDDDLLESAIFRARLEAFYMRAHWVLVFDTATRRVVKRIDGSKVKKRPIRKNA